MRNGPPIKEWTGQHPQVRLLSDELFTLLGAGRGAYEDALMTEYGHAEQVITTHEFIWGVLTSITFPESPARPRWTTDLIFGGCEEAQVREYLVSIGLGGVPIKPVAAPGTP